jgi:5-methylthioadenosine/S-adenosylhomocysteine deaminase
MNPEGESFSPGAVAVEGDRIVDVGPLDQMQSRYRPTRMIGGDRKIVMPGLVDAYAHAGHGMIKGIYTSKLGWPASEMYFHGSTPEWWKADGLLTGMERVKFGVTTGHSTLGATPARADDAVYSEAHVEAVTQVGLRDLLGIGPPNLFLRPGPFESTDWRSGSPETRTFTYDDTMRVSAEVVERFHNSADGRVTVCLAVPYLVGMSPRLMTGMHNHAYSADDIREVERRGVEAQEFAQRYGILIHTHGARGTFEYAQEVFGEGMVDEILGGNVVVAHGHGLNMSDIDVLKRTGPSVVWVPFGSWGVRFGPAPIAEMIREGIRCCVATDGAAPFHVSDLFVDIHRAQFLLAEKYQDSSVLPPGKALRLVTIDAAAALGMDDQIGSLEAGKKADIIVIDADQPHLTPGVAAPQLVAWYVRGNDVESVIVDGRVLMEKGALTTVDQQDVLEMVRREAAAAFERVDTSAYLEQGDAFWNGWRA